QNHQIRPPAFRSAVGIVLLARAVTADGKAKIAWAAVLHLHLAGLLPTVQSDECTPSVQCIDDAAEKNEQQTGVHDINRQFRKAVALAKQRKAVLANNVLRPEACLVECTFGDAQGLFFIFNRNQRMVGEGIAKTLVSTLIRT